MGFEERFPELSRAVRLLFAVVLPLVFMLVPYGMAVTSPSVHGYSMEGLGERGPYVLFLAVEVLFFGGIGAEIAFPHRARVPALLVAGVVALMGFSGVLSDLAREGAVYFPAFHATFVAPPTYVLGALAWEGRLRKKRRATP